MEREDVIREVAKEVLNFEGQQMVEDHIAEENVHRAAIVVLGGIDRKVNDQEIEASVARHYYAQLGLSDADVLRIRANNGNLWEK